MQKIKLQNQQISQLGDYFNCNDIISRLITITETYVNYFQ